MTQRLFGFLLACLLLIPSMTIANAQESDPVIPKNNNLDMPVMTQEIDSNFDMTHPILRLTPDKSEMIRLDQDAASVIVGNPNHISVLLDTPNTLVVVPRNAGASHFSIIGEDGSVIMQRHVIVGGAKEQYVRIRRSCAGSRDCQPTSVYFCPDMCHEVQENRQN